MEQPVPNDAAHNAHIFLNVINRGAKYEGGKTETWAYRYKRVADADEKPKIDPGKATTLTISR